MKKRIYSFIVLIVISILLTSCAGTADWDFSLPNDYELWHINSNEILVKYVGEEQNYDEIPSFVKEFAYNERYVYTRNVEKINQNNIFSEVYYVLDTKEKRVYGPFNSIEELKKETKPFDAEIPTIWYRTSPDPNTCIKE